MPEELPFHIPEIPKSEEAPQEKENLELEPLSEKEKEELKSLFTELKNEQGQSYFEYRWQIAEKFGERAIPYLIENYRELKTGFVESVHFFDALATEKTAPMILEAMKKGEVGIWEAAIGAAAGKEKTAPGLAEILKDLKLIGDRGPHIRLLEALGEARVDETAPQIVQFYERLRVDEHYAERVAEHLKVHGVDLYSCDAYDIIKSLSWIGGPKAKEAIEHFASSGDKYIKKAAKEALSGKLYIGHPSKYEIKKPISQESSLYSIKSDLDFMPEETIKIPEAPLASSGDKYIKEAALEALDGKFYIGHPSRIKMPEQLTSNKMRLSFLESSHEWQEKYQEHFKDYFSGKSGVFELLGKISNNEKIKHWRDFPEEKYGEALQAAVSLESFKVLLKAPDLRGMREGIDGLHHNLDKWQKEKVSFSNEEASVNFRRTFKRCHNFLEDFNELMGVAKQEDFRLPESAGAFQLWHEGLGKARPVKPFVELLRGKLENHFTKEAFGILKGEKPISWIKSEAFRELSGFFQVYRDVENYDVPVYKEAAERLKKVAKEQPMVFYGRDADYFYYAVKAQRFGLVGNKKPREVYINRTLMYELQNPDSKVRERILAYLLQEKVSADALHIDTGYHGSVPEAVIKALNPDLTPEQINKRIKLLESSTKARESLSSKSNASNVSRIENLRHKYGEIQDVIRDEKTGRLKVRYNKPDFWNEIGAWVINQTIIRNFAPRQEKK